MNSGSSASTWEFRRFALIVTGVGEEEFLPRLLRSLTAGGHSTFRVHRRIGQLRPLTSKARLQRLHVHGKVIPTVDEELGLAARQALARDDFVIVVDDSERYPVAQSYRRYRTALDTILVEGQRGRASVHFLVNMIEAYYFADSAATNAVLGTTLVGPAGDVEAIPHPKNSLKALTQGGFDEVKHGRQIVARLDLARVLDDAETCASLRTLFGWCTTAMREPMGPTYRLGDGAYCRVTGPQLAALP